MKLEEMFDEIIHKESKIDPKSDLEIWEVYGFKGCCKAVYAKYNVTKDCVEDHIEFKVTRKKRKELSSLTESPEILKQHFKAIGN